MALLGGVLVLTALSAQALTTRESPSVVALEAGRDYDSLSRAGHVQGVVGRDAIDLDLRATPGTVTTFGSVLALVNHGPEPEVARFESVQGAGDGVSLTYTVGNVSWDPAVGPSPAIRLAPHERVDVDITLDWRAEATPTTLHVVLV